MKSRKDSADKGAGSGCMARLVRCSSFFGLFKDRRVKNRETWEPTLEQLRESHDMLMRRIESDNSGPQQVAVLVGKKLHVCRLRTDHGLPCVRVKFVDLATSHNLAEMVIPFAESLDKIEEVRL